MISLKHIENGCVVLTDFSASEGSDIGLMSELCFWAKCEEPRICQTENSSNAKGFLWRTKIFPVTNNKADPKLKSKPKLRKNDISQRDSFTYGSNVFIAKSE